MARQRRKRTDSRTKTPGPTAKGNILEQAVHAIESVIIANSPGASKDTFEIQGKKIITVGGVHHEIDIYVTLKHAAGYESVFIFDCRNREQKANKNDIIVFTEKIKVAGAQRGFFIAKAYSRDAKAQGTTVSR